MRVSFQSFLSRGLCEQEGHLAGPSAPVRTRPFPRLSPMSTTTHYDIIIIDTGPGGGTLAYKMAPSWKKILLLERGGYRPREKDNWSSKSVFIDNKYKAKETWKDKDGGTFHPGIHYNVGGNSNYERRASRCLPGCRERKVERIVQEKRSLHANPSRIER